MKKKIEKNKGNRGSTGPENRPGQTQVKYTSQGHPPAQLHEATSSVGYADAVINRWDAPLERETDLAEALVTDIDQNGADVKTLCDTYELKREELGRLTGFSLRALAEWAGGRLPSQPARRRLHEVRRLLDALAQIVRPASIPRWLHQRNAAFGHLTPLQVIEFGEIDRLWAMLHDLESGQPE